MSIARAGDARICSHTALTALNPNKRNTSRSRLYCDSATGAFIVFFCLNDYLARNAANAKPARRRRSPYRGLSGHLDT